MIAIYKDQKECLDKLELEITNAMWFQKKTKAELENINYKVAEFEGFTSKEYPKLFKLLKDRKCDLELVDNPVIEFKTIDDSVVNYNSAINLKVVSLEGEHRNDAGEYWNWHFLFDNQPKPKAFEYVDRVGQVRVITNSEDELIDFFLKDDRNMSKQFKYDCDILT